jgi:predicted RNase H-related nuclease YkuK (DUF458 family)
MQSATSSSSRKKHIATRQQTVWRRPVGFDVKFCGQHDLHWDISTQKILVCYEMAQDFADLYRGCGLTDVMKPDADAKAKKKATKATKK